MPQLQRTIDGLLIRPTTAPVVVAATAPPTMLYCACGLEATADNRAGRSVCDDCQTRIICEGCSEETEDVEEINGEQYCAGCAENFNECNDCGERVHNDDTTTIDDAEVCDSCRGDNYSRCDDCREWDHNDDCVQDDSNTYCESCGEHYHACEDCSCLVHDDNSYCDNNGNTVCESCYEENYFSCDSCCETYHNDSAGRCGMCSCCWDNLDCDERAELIIEHEHSGGRTRIEYRDRPVAATNPVRQNRPNNSDCCVARPFAPRSNGCTETGSYRTYGVELETSSCPGAADMSGRTVFRSSTDGSITGWEFNSAVLSGDAGLTEIEKFCDLADDNSFAVDSKCGYHAHFGVDELSDEQRYNIALAYYYFQPVWSAFVSEARRATSFCLPIKWRPVVYAGTIRRIEYVKGTVRRDFNITEGGDSFSTFADAIDRYCWFNVASYPKHGTIELRLHPGTVSAKKINNWIIAHLRFIEFVANLSREAIVREFNGASVRTLFTALLELMPADVATYLTERAAQFGMTVEVDSTETADAMALCA